MQLVALKYFVAVADHGSFTAAAERLGVSASTLTRSVSTLEDNLGPLARSTRWTRDSGMTPRAVTTLEQPRRQIDQQPARDPMDGWGPCKREPPS